MTQAEQDAANSFVNRDWSQVYKFYQDNPAAAAGFRPQEYRPEGGDEAYVRANGYDGSETQRMVLPDLPILAAAPVSKSKYLLYGLLAAAIASVLMRRK